VLVAAANEQAEALTLRRQRFNDRLAGQMLGALANGMGIDELARAEGLSACVVEAFLAAHRDRARRRAVGARVDSRQSSSAANAVMPRTVMPRSAVPHRLTRSRLSVEEMWERYCRGATLDDVAALAGVSHERVRQLLVAAGHQPRSPRQAGRLRKAQALVLARARAREVVELWRAGCVPRQIARDLQLTLDAVGVVLEENLTELERRRRAAAARRARGPALSAEDARRAVRAAALELGRVPASYEYDRLARGRARWPSAATIAARWGWAQLLTEAGLAAAVRRERRRDFITAAQCADAVAQAARLLGRAPSLAEYEALRCGRDWPCVAIVRRRLGGWAGALEVSARALCGQDRHCLAAA